MRLSIITPVYNRKKIIIKLYESLKKQTNKKFEWIIIDDGSTDSLQEEVQGWINNKCDFKIRYYYKENGGKHTALNLGIEKSDFEYIFIVDSDDYLLNESVSKIYQMINNLEGKKSNRKFAGISGLKIDQRSNLIGKFPNKKNYVDMKNNKRGKKLSGDKAEIYKREILIKYPFPEFPNENFLQEDAVWNKIAIDNFYIRWFNEPLIVCEYLEEGLSRNLEKNLFNNFEGYTYVVKQRLKYLKGIYRYNQLYIYYAIAIKKRFRMNQIAEKLGVKKISLIFAVKIMTIANNIFRRK